MKRTKTIFKIILVISVVVFVGSILLAIYADFLSGKKPGLPIKSEYLASLIIVAVLIAIYCLWQIYPKRFSKLPNKGLLFIVSLMIYGFFGTGALLLKAMKLAPYMLDTWILVGGLPVVGAIVVYSKWCAKKNKQLTRQRTIGISVVVALLIGLISLICVVQYKATEQKRINSLINNLGSENLVTSGRAYITLDTIGKSALPMLIETVENKKKDRKIRGGVILLLREIGDKRAIPTLIETLKDNDPAIRAIAAEALGWIGDKTALSPLEEALRVEKKSKVQQEITEAIYRLETK